MSGTGATVRSGRVSGCPIIRARNAREQKKLDPDCLGPLAIRDL
ncbi:hypothetical protein WME89_07780 [Sorangium sp. So ce321]